MSMKTPICDFVNKYRAQSKLRLHMPGHKGARFLGFEEFDITEISGADSLYEASGIIAESERNASDLFGCDTYYSTEGSSQCIKAMVYLSVLAAKKEGRRPLIAAGRNAHKAFHSALALLDVDVLWIYPKNIANYLSCDISARDVEEFLSACEEKPTALYLTSPDYLGNMADVRSIAKVCRENGILLLVDNAHGAYLRFLSESAHPMDLGADLCCDSAHKTLPVLTGGAYLHVASDFDTDIKESIKDAMCLFGSTSPSYLILQSLDAANSYLEGHRERLASFVPLVDALKEALSSHGYELYGAEPLKVTLHTKAYGYLGTEFAQILEERGVVCEFADPDFVVLMLTPELCESGLKMVKAILLSIERKERILGEMPEFRKAERVCRVREAVTSQSETVSAENSLGRVAALTHCSCPPAVPVVVSGERIDENAIKCFEYYGIKEIKVIKKD